MQILCDFLHQEHLNLMHTSGIFMGQSVEIFIYYV